MDDFITSLDVIYQCLAGLVIEANESIGSTSNLNSLLLTFKLESDVNNIASSLGIPSTDIEVGVKEYTIYVDSLSVLNDTILLIKGMKAVACKVYANELSLKVSEQELLVIVLVREGE